jgi:hypothetical protein
MLNTVDVLKGDRRLSSMTSQNSRTTAPEPVLKNADDIDDEGAVLVKRNLETQEKMDIIVENGFTEKTFKNESHRPSLPAISQTKVLSQLESHRPSLPAIRHSASLPPIQSPDTFKDVYHYDEHPRVSSPLPPIQQESPDPILLLSDSSDLPTTDNTSNQAAYLTIASINNNDTEIPRRQSTSTLTRKATRLSIAPSLRSNSKKVNSSIGEVFASNGAQLLNRGATIKAALGGPEEEFTVERFDDMHNAMAEYETSTWKDINKESLKRVSRKAIFQL